ncbi:acyl-CoA dehydrogenase family protein [uncultured Abyssibacter sp.]|uniref:acyl-CoA dehydrogenase family protein n=1 Tax=uncultured Abyssibacter sp. TaxID=2320202 RepID=UPI0032B2B010
MSIADQSMARGLRVLNRLAGGTLLDRLGVRKQSERAIYHASRTGFGVAAAAARSFKGGPKPDRAQRLPSAGDPGLFDLTPSEDQAMLQDAAQRFADEALRPAAEEANEACSAEKDLLDMANELGIAILGIPEELGGAGTERSTVTNVLVAEALAHGDMGLAFACLAPSAVSNALVLWGNAEQQGKYLPAFAEETTPVAALALSEPVPLFDPMSPATVAKPVDGGWSLSGIKSLVPNAATCELFIIGAMVEGEGPALFVVESDPATMSIAPDPAMGLRAAATGQVQLDGVVVPTAARLGDGAKAATDAYTECVRLSRLAWCAMAIGTGKAVLDYVIPYVNDRQAFGEPISHRQSVAFMVANIAIELEGMRLTTLRAASLAERGKAYAREAAVARRLCVDKGMQIGSDGVQLLGGHGFTKEYPVERWYRDLRAIGVMEGGLLV